MKSKYIPKYFEFLREDENLEKVADLIEAVKRASVIGWDGDTFSQAATCDILRKLYDLLPNQKIINTNENIRKILEGE